MKEQEKTESIRAFIALSLSDEVMGVLKARSVALREQFSALNIRWVPWKNYHLTLSFIGNVPLSDVDRLEKVVREAVVGFSPFSLTLGDVVLFPPDQKVKGLFIAAVTLDQALNSLQTRIEADLRAADYSIYDRTYNPHITLARLRKNRVGEDALTPSGTVLNSPVEHVHIYESHKEGGAVVNSIVRTIKL